MSNTTVSLQILKSLSDATAEIVEKTAPSVASVSCGMARGSGIVWSSDGYILTCNHVIRRGRTISVGFREGENFEAKLIGHDPYSDVALLKIEAKDLKPIELSDTQTLKTGQFVLALANPFSRKASATSGIVTNPSGSIRGFGGTAMEDVIVTDAQLNPGYSGGPLVDVSGKVIGINVAYAWSRGIALPIPAVRETVEGLMTEGKIKRAYLGIQAGTIPLPADVAKRAEVDQNSGVLVLSVERNSAAKDAGLALSDIIVKFNGKPITNVDDLTRVLNGETIGKKAKLSVLRGEQITTLTATPSAARDENDE